METAEILTILVGNGVILTIVVATMDLIYKRHEGQIERDVTARRDARKYYMTLYAHIAILTELMGGYQRSVNSGKTKVFAFKECRHMEMSSEEILDRFKEAYMAFSSYYIGKKREGYEIFVSKKLRELLIRFWARVECLYENEKTMKDERQIADVQEIADETIEHMEKLYGLR